MSMSDRFAELNYQENEGGCDDDEERETPEFIGNAKQTNGGIGAAGTRRHHVGKQVIVGDHLKLTQCDR